MAEEEKKTEEVEPVVIEHKSSIEALAYAQLEWKDKPLKPNKVVDYLTKAGDRVNYSYATLDALRAATDPCLNKHGLTLTHRTEIRDKREILVATLEHAFSDIIKEAELDITESSGDMQEFGKLMTFAQRYTYCMLTGRVAEKDTDAKDGKRRKQEEQSQEGKKDKTPLEKAKITYFTLLSKNKVFKNDGERHEWQKITPYGFSTEKWTKAGFEGAAGLMNWRLVVGVESDKLLEFVTTKAKSTRGLQASFLKLMGVKKLTDLKDITHWKIGMASAKLSIDHKLEAALDMGKVLIRADAIEGLFAKFLEEVELEKLSTMTAAQVESWEEFLKLAVTLFNTENPEAKVDVEKLISGEEEKV